MIPVSRRRYLPGGFLAHAAGYVVKSANSRSKRVNGKLRPRLRRKDWPGAQYNDLLQAGRHAAARRNSIAKKWSGWPLRKPFRKQIQLTIDYDLQQIASNPWAASWCQSHWTRAPESIAMVSHPRWTQRLRVRIRGGLEEPQRRSATSIAQPAIQAQLAPGLFLNRHSYGHVRGQSSPENFTTFCRDTPPFTAAVQVLHLREGSQVCGLAQSDPQSCDIFFYNVGMRLALTDSPTTQQTGLDTRPESISLEEPG